MLKLLAEAFENLTKVFRKTKNPAVKDELIKIGDELEALSEQVQKGSGKIEEQTTQLKTILTNLDGQAKQIDEGLDDIISTIDEYDPPSVTNRPQGKSANMADSAERSIQFVAEKTGLSFEEARLAIMEKINEGYAIGNAKRTLPNDMASIKAYLDNNLSIGSSGDAIEFLEDIEEIAFSGAIDLASDAAKNVSKQNAKQIIDSSLPGDEFGETLIDFDSAPKTLEDTFENVPPDRRSVMEEMYAPIIEEQKIIEATQKEIQQTAAKIQDLIEQGRVDEAEALAESLKDFQTQLKSTDSALDATIIPPNRTLNAKGGRIGLENGGGPKIGRRAFLGGLGAGIASLFIPRGAAKVATTAAKAAPEIAAQGMPNWFPLLVNRIKTEGKQIKFAGNKKQPENRYVIEDRNGTQLTLEEDALTGNISVYGRGDSSQQFDFEYIPATKYSRPDGKSFVEEGEFYGYEKYKTDGPDVEVEGTFDEMQGGYKELETFATKGKKTTRQELDELASDFKRVTQKEDLDFAKGGRVGYKYGGGIGELFKEKRI